MKIKIYKWSFKLQRTQESDDLQKDFNKSGLALWNDVEIIAEYSAQS